MVGSFFQQTLCVKFRASQNSWAHEEHYYLAKNLQNSGKRELVMHWLIQWGCIQIVYSVQMLFLPVQGMCAWSLRCVLLFANLWTGAHQVPLSMGLSSQEYGSGWPFSSPEDLLDPGFEPMSPATLGLAGEFFFHWATWEAPFLFPPNKCFTCFCFSVEIHFLEMNPNGQDSALGQTSISAQKPKSYFKSLQVEVTQAQICLHKNLCLCSWKKQQQQQGDLRGSTDSR